MKLKYKKRILILIIMIGICFTNLSYAITPMLKCKCSRGTNISYYIENGNENVFEQNKHISNAIKNWEHTGHGYNPIYMRRKNNNKGTAIDFHHARKDHWNDAGNLKNYIMGETVHRNGHGTGIDGNIQNWLFSDIYLCIDNLGPRTYGEIQGTIAHEIGHAFGLDEYYNNRNSIMYPILDYRLVHTVQKEDNDAINKKYR